MKIERVVIADAPVLNDIARIAIVESVEVSDEVRQHAIADTARHIDENISCTDCAFLKLTSETHVIGFILIQDFWNLSDLFVLPEWHGKGAGKALFKAAKMLCLESSHKDYIRLYSSLNAEGFYRWLGFESFDPGKPYPTFVVPLTYRLDRRRAQ